MDRRHGPRDRQRQVQRLAVQQAARHDGGAGIAHVGDEAEQGSLVEQTRLGGDVRRGEHHAVVARLPVGAILGDDLARGIGLELIDHHAVEAAK